ncbi:TP53-target gene 5 protein [Cynocephalus volans]|uniref:TP53-target gene 5 protein n=1 Tax=Cynocephalus volans TaxID=110931 RepID=UPI002FC8C86D
MSPSAKKRPKNSEVSKMQDEELQDNIKQPVRKVIEWNRLRMVLKNLSLLKLLKSSNRRIQKLYYLAKRYRNSLLSVPNIFHISSGDSNVCNKVKQYNEEFQEARYPKKKLETKKLEYIGKYRETEPSEWKPKVESGMHYKAKGSPAAVPWKEEEAEPEVPTTSRGHGLNNGAQRRQPSSGDPQVILLKNHQHRISKGNIKQLDVGAQCMWFEGLPTRIHLPAPRVMCRTSALRWVKRRCTRFCSASLQDA